MDKPYELPNDSSIGSLYYELGRKLVDLRDHKSYRTLAVGSQIWMAENLNFEKDSSICYKYSQDSCAKYGRLYQWHSAMDESEDMCGMGNSCNSNKEIVQGACPGGWLLPSVEEWQQLFDFVGGSNIAGKKLKSGSGWYSGEKGENYGFFSMKPSGGRNKNGFSAERYGAWLWTSSEFSADSSKYAHFSTYNYADTSKALKSNYMGIRCLKNN